LKRDIKDKIIEINNSKFNIRLLRKEDKEMLIDFFESLSEKTKKVFQPHPFDKNTVKKIIYDLDKDIDILRFLVIDVVLGKAIAYLLLWNLRDYYLYFGIGISDDYQGKGLGNLLMDYSIQVAKKLGKNGLILTVYKNNTAAYNLYLKKGFEVVKDIYTMKLDFNN
jgi:ribosomal protein S18 acetylase RimI-like enzyme